MRSLANFSNDGPIVALERIVHRIEETTTGDFPLRTYFNQLRVLAQLRNLGNQLTELAMDNVTRFFSVEKDAAYMIAQKAEQKKFVTYLLNEIKHTDEQIADIAGVTVDFVNNVRREVKSGK